MKKKNSIIAIGIVVGIGLIVFLASFTSSKFNNISKYKLLETPVPINSINVSVRIANYENTLKSIIKYENNSSHDISNMVIEVRFKSENKVVSYELNELVKSGQISSDFYGEAPDSGNEEDLEFLKYKVTLKKGTYMEYDQTTNTYNWS